MDPERTAEIAQRLRKTADKLEAADLLVEAGKVEDAISRAYYAAYHAAQALLVARGVPARSHSGVLSLIGLHFVQTGRIDRDAAKTLHALREDRENGDYTAVTFFDEEDARRAIDGARRFAERARELLADDFGWEDPFTAG